jgi:signal transduction histidine kinase
VIQEDKKSHPKIQQSQAAIASVDERMIALMRLTLAVSALLIIYIDPSEPDRFVVLTYLALVVYVLYSGIILWLSFYDRAPRSIAPWIDVGCYLVLVSLSSGTSSVFFFFFFFPILVASFRRGFKQGIWVTLVSSILFTIIGYATAPGGSEFELNRFLLRPVYLSVLGYMIAYWGGQEIKLKRRLSLLREIINLSNPRFGVSFTIGSMLKKVQAFYDADLCLFILIDPVHKDTRLFRARREQDAESIVAERIPETFENLLLSFPDDVAIIHQPYARKAFAFDLTKQKKCSDNWQATCDAVASKLDLGAFVSVPLSYRDKRSGRLYMTAAQRSFGLQDIDFLMQVGEQVMPTIHNIRLLAQLAWTAAEGERRRMARDVHDSVIQPYIGLQYKLAAIRAKGAEGKSTMEDVERLFEMTVDEVTSLRGFVTGLKEGESTEFGFLASVRRFAAQFGASYDLEIQVESNGEIEIGNTLAQHLIRIIQEGLSNVRKHTTASFCRIVISRADSNLRLSIENDNPRATGATGADFYPRSITERTEDLGGHVKVEHSVNGLTTVRVEVPL